MKKTLILLSIIYSTLAFAQNIEEGQYFIRNVYTGMYLGSGNDWGTHAIQQKHPQEWGLENVGSGKYDLNSYTYNGGDLHYLGSNNYVDASRQDFELAKSDKGYIMWYSNGAEKLCLTGRASKNDVEWNTYRRMKSTSWLFLTRSDLLEELSSATPTKPVDATFLISSPNFNRNDSRNVESWNYPQISIGGDNTNNVAAGSGKFTAYQMLSGMPSGSYILRAQAYTVGKVEKGAVLFAKDAEGQYECVFTVYSDLDRSRTTASHRFLEGLDTQEMVFYTQGGELNIGISYEENDDVWTVMDNFELYYLGSTKTDKYEFPTQATIEDEPLPAKEPTELKQLSDVPTLYINTVDGNSITSKTIYKYATMYEVTANDTTMYDSLQIRGRGNSTWGLAKKPYRLKFNSKEKFLGKGHAKAKSWVLMANHADKTMLRNSVAAYIGEQLGMPFCPGSRFVDLVINDKYLGTYQITDHVDIKKKRVDIVEQEEAATDTSNITGGYLLEADGFYDEEYKFMTNHNVPIMVKSPDSDIINRTQKTYIRNYIQDIENALFCKDFTDAEKGYRPMVDSLTLASWYIGTEFTGNVDGLYSVYLYKDADDPLLYFGPMWDFDIAFDNCNRTGSVVDKLMVNAGFGTNVIKPWIEQMWKDPWFVNLISKKWQQARKHGIVENTNAYIDSMATVIDQTQQLNYNKYSLYTRYYNELVLFSTYQEGVDYLKDYIEIRADFMDSIFGIAPDDTEPDDDGPTDYVADLSENDYRVVYRSDAQMIVIQQPKGQNVDGTISLYDTNGKLVGTGSTTKAISTASLPDGVYIVTWNVEGHKRSTKLYKK